jgi:hypothetical protein
MITGDRQQGNLLSDFLLGLATICIVGSAIALRWVKQWEGTPVGGTVNTRLLWIGGVFLASGLAGLMLFSDLFQYLGL